MQLGIASSGLFPSCASSFPYPFKACTSWRWLLLAMAPLLKAFTAALKANPVAVNAITGASLVAGSDFLAQRLEKRLHLEKGWQAANAGCNDADMQWCDIPRLLSSCLIGASFGGFVYPFAYARLDMLFPGNKLLSVIQKSVVEIMTVGLFVNSVSIGTRGLLAGRTAEDVARHVAHEMPRVTFNDARAWGPYNLVAFAFIPSYIRPTTTALMEATWQTYISLRSHDYMPKPELKAARAEHLF